MTTDKAIEMLKKTPVNPQAALKIELNKSEKLIEKIIEYRSKLQKENLHWGHVGDAKRFNELLAEAINTTN
jgi:restriction endonuclease Mrr